MIELIPAIDIIEGKCVRLTKGDYSTQKVYNQDPLSIAREMESYGLTRLHLVDLDGARLGHVVNYRTLERIAGATSLIIDFGGGIKTDEDLRIAHQSGASMFTIGSIAVKSPKLFLDWLACYGSERIILGADVKDGYISISGWVEESSHELFDFLESYTSKGVTQVLCTDIARDGMLQGPSTELYSRVLRHFPDLHLIASGGVSSLDDLKALEQAGIPAVVFGKALYEGRISLKQISDWLYAR